MQFVIIIVLIETSISHFLITHKLHRSNNETFKMSSLPLQTKLIGRIVKGPSVHEIYLFWPLIVALLVFKIMQFFLSWTLSFETFLKKSEKPRNKIVYLHRLKILQNICFLSLSIVAAARLLFLIICAYASNCAVLEGISLNECARDDASYQSIKWLSKHFSCKYFYMYNNSKCA